MAACSRALLDLPAATQPIRVLPTTHVLNQPRSALIPRPCPHPDARTSRPTPQRMAGTVLDPGGGGRGAWRPDRGDAESVHPPILATVTVRDSLSCSLLPAGSPLASVCMCLPAFEPATCACTRAFLLYHIERLAPSTLLHQHSFHCLLHPQARAAHLR
jgi:hypothetical protein